MSEFHLNLSNQVQQKAELKSAFVTALANLVSSPHFGGPEIHQLYTKTLADLQSEYTKKGSKCADILSPGSVFLQENTAPISYYGTDDLINLS
jgi:hypothetical protein